MCFSRACRGSEVRTKMVHTARGSDGAGAQGQVDGRREYGEWQRGNEE